jgi:hypothetical protein
MLVFAFGLLIGGPVDVGFAQSRPPVGIGQPPPPPDAAPRRRGLLELLFGPRAPAQPPSLVTRQRAASGAPAVPVAEITAKDPNARKIMVIGDFVAGGVAWGLGQTFAEEARLVVLDRANSNSGLVRDDYHDWNQRLPEMLNEDHPDIIVIVMGSNDRQQIRDGKDRLAMRSESWEKIYGERIDNLIDTLKVYGRPFFWVSAPPMRSSSASRDMAYLNELLKPRVTAGGGYFIDIWNGFTNEDGRFISSGPDVEGQLRALRNSDGINFTRAGRLKLAFYVEREIRHQTGIGPGVVDLSASASQASQIEIGLDGKKRLVGPVISLSDPLPGTSLELTGEVALIGDRVVGGAPTVAPLLAAPADVESPQYLLIIKGAALPSVAGRADDFTWPRRALAALPVEPAALSEASLPAADVAPAQAAN